MGRIRAGLNKGRGSGRMRTIRTPSVADGSERSTLAGGGSLPSLDIRIVRSSQPSMTGSFPSPPHRLRPFQHSEPQPPMRLRAVNAQRPSVYQQPYGQPPQLPIPSRREQRRVRLRRRPRGQTPAARLQSRGDVPAVKHRRGVLPARSKAPGC